MGFSLKVLNNCSTLPICMLFLDENASVTTEASEDDQLLKQEIVRNAGAGGETPESDKSSDSDLEVQKQQQPQASTLDSDSLTIDNSV